MIPQPQSIDPTRALRQGAARGEFSHHADQIQVHPDLDGLGGHEDIDPLSPSRIEESRLLLLEALQVPRTHPPHP